MKLLSAFEDRRVRAHDSEGGLVAAGYSWLEEVVFIVVPFGLSGIGLILCGLGGASGKHLQPSEAIGFVFVGLLCFAICLQFGSIRRGVVFERGGRTRPLGGWANRLEYFRGICDHAHIASIEAVKTERGMGVAIYSVRGGTTLVSNGLTEAEARLGAVQLTQALRELRESMSSVRHHVRMPGEPRVLID